MIPCLPVCVFRELGSVNSPLGAKQNCPSPNASDAQNNPKSSERVNFFLFVCLLFICLQAQGFLHCLEYLAVSLFGDVLCEM